MNSFYKYSITKTYCKLKIYNMFIFFKTFISEDFLFSKNPNENKSKRKEVKQKQTGKNHNKILNKKIQIVIIKKGNF